MKKLQKIVRQLENCEFECVGENLSNNSAFIELKKLASKKEPSKPALSDFQTIILRYAPSITRREMLNTAKACYNYIIKKSKI